MLNLHQYRVAFIDLWCHFQFGTDGFTLYGVVDTAGRAGLAAGDDRDFLTYVKGGFFVIQRYNARGSQNITLGIALKGGD